MNQQGIYTPQDGQTTSSGDFARITVLEALADAAYGVGPCRSNQTTPPAADASDQ